MKGAVEGGWKGAAQATINQDLDLIKSCIEVTRDAARPRCGTERQRGMMRFLMLPPSCRSSAGFVFNDVATVARLRRRFYEQGLVCFPLKDACNYHVEIYNIYLVLCNIQNTGSPAQFLCGLSRETQICNIANIN